MDILSKQPLSLESVIADRRLVDRLAAEGLISAEVRTQAMELIYPAKSWGLWASRLLLLLGVALILAGVIYFFAFNWQQITPAQKFIGIQLSILACLLGSYCYGIQQRLSGKVLLLCASVLVGVFLAVFGQVYQTGADAYTLFLTWSLLILAWVLFSEFAALWVVWLGVTNTFLVLYWNQYLLPEKDVEILIFPLLALFNGLFLGLREFYDLRGANWLSARWTRVLLVLTILVCALPPAFLLIDAPTRATTSVVSGSLVTLIVHLVLYNFYRFKVCDLWSQAAIYLSICILSVTAFHKVFRNIFGSESLTLLLLGFVTLGMFTVAVVSLRKQSKN